MKILLTNVAFNLFAKVLELYFELCLSLDFFKSALIFVCRPQYLQQVLYY
jgi:hypothetical protein